MLSEYLDTRGSSHDAHCARNGLTASTGDGTSGNGLVLSLPTSRVSPDHKGPLSTILPADPARRGVCLYVFLHRHDGGSADTHRVAACGMGEFDLRGPLTVFDCMIQSSSMSGGRRKDAGRYDCTTGANGAVKQRQIRGRHRPRRGVALVVRAARSARALLRQGRRHGFERLHVSRHRCAHRHHQLPGAMMGTVGLIVTLSVLALAASLAAVLSNSRRHYDRYRRKIE